MNHILGTDIEASVHVYLQVSALNSFTFFQDEKNQIMTTNVWVTQVRFHGNMYTF